MANDDVMGIEKLKMSAKFIFKDPNMIDKFWKINEIFVTHTPFTSFIWELFENLKSEEPITLDNSDVVEVIDFMVI